jgi:hypothetical protein
MPIGVSYAKGVGGHIHEALAQVCDHVRVIVYTCATVHTFYYAQDFIYCHRLQNDIGFLVSRVLRCAGIDFHTKETGTGKSPF